MWAQAKVKCDSGGFRMNIDRWRARCDRSDGRFQSVSAQTLMCNSPFYNHFKGTFLPQTQRDLSSHILTTTKESGRSLTRKTLNCQVPGFKMWNYNRNRKTIGKRPPPPHPFVQVFKVALYPVASLYWRTFIWNQFNTSQYLETGQTLVWICLVLQVYWSSELNTGTTKVKKKTLKSFFLVFHCSCVLGNCIFFLSQMYLFVPAR